MLHFTEESFMPAEGSPQEQAHQLRTTETLWGLAGAGALFIAGLSGADAATSVAHEIAAHTPLTSNIAYDVGVMAILGTCGYFSMKKSISLGKQAKKLETGHTTADEELPHNDE
jgi:hypothetical protein